jgi:thioredoxin 1
MTKILSIILTFFIFGSAICQSDGSTSVIEKKGLTVEAFQKITNESKKLVYFNFSADWCVVCKRQAPMIEKFAQNNKQTVEVISLDMKANPLIAEFFEVDGLPINMLYKNGALVWDRMGLQTTEQLNEVIKKFQ